MAFKLTEEEKKSLVITVLSFALLLIALIFFKYTQKSDLVDLSELEGGGGGGGVTVNFGDSDVGSGADFRSEVLNVTEKVKQVPQAATPADEEEIVASDLDDAPAVVKTKPIEKKEPKKVETKPVSVKAPPHPSKSTSDALANLLNGNNKGGDGDDGVAGNKGKQGGDKNSGSYYGDGGSGGGSGGGNGSGNGIGTGPGSGSGSGGGSGAGRGTGVGNYQLGGRKNLNTPKPQYRCNEEGTVVVQITVNRSGKVIKVERGRGTTNAAQCLFDQAKAAAFDTKFDSSDSAPETQVGKIIYNFKLTD
ncbi:energy transducer TonB [Flavobacterium sp. DG1-102-2]|uniref:energy transducer TonB family protein n=1 Tax=Flavobacterium sp. DG1-102-2 TaxID=3081663 RepID=UPI00294A5FF1|nr:energy transducer TonB [Flavobacterium sp. DG1-102-2]MDV6168200.1 energy transducer TonB [Flavobacterium sp. DG1-102-2]